MSSEALPRTANSARQIWTGIYTGAVLSVIVLIASLSFGTLIFTGDLAPGVGAGIQAALTSAAIIGLIIATRSSFSGNVGIPQDRTAPILALLAAQVVAALPAGLPVNAQIANVLVALALTSALTGMVLYFLGHFKLGNFTRFIPYPVVGGFLSGSGWLLVRGSFKVMTGHTLAFGHLGEFFVPATLKLWLPGIALGLLLFILLRRFRQNRLVPVILLGSMGLFWIVARAAGLGLAEARAAGWLPDIPTGGAAGEHIWLTSTWAAVEWRALLHGGGLAATAALTATISILLNSSALELAVEQEIDLNRELRVAGVANLMSGLGGGLLGFQSLTLTRLSRDLGSRNRLAGAVTAIICGLALFAGPGLFAGLPKFALGGLLFYTGLGFLVEWLWDGWAKFPRSDYAVVISIVAVMGTLGYAEGVGFGVLAAVILFIHNYSRVGVITHTLTGVEMQSNVDRPVEHQRLLAREGARLHLLKLQGFIFFGTANTILNNSRERVENRQLPPLRCVMLDFRRVSGLDSSAALSLAKAGQLARKSGFQCVLTQVPPEMQSHIRRGTQRADQAETLKFFPDLDHALEWWESQALKEFSNLGSQSPTGLRQQLLQHWPNPATLDQFLGRLSRRELADNEHLIRQGELADELFFLESGEVSTVLEGRNGAPARRLRRQGAGTVLGELGLLLKVPRSASVIVLRPAVAYVLTAQALAKLQRDCPGAAADFFAYLSRSLAERVLTTTRSLRVLTD